MLDDVAEFNFVIPKSGSRLKIKNALKQFCCSLSSAKNSVPTSRVVTPLDLNHETGLTMEVSIQYKH